MASDFSEVTFAPVAFNQVGVHSVSIDLYDDAGARLSYPFYVTVKNDAPYFTLPYFPTSYSVSLNNILEITIDST
jgi:hypothetical protein